MIISASFYLIHEICSRILHLDIDFYPFDWTIIYMYFQTQHRYPSEPNSDDARLIESSEKAVEAIKEYIDKHEQEKNQNFFDTLA